MIRRPPRSTRTDTLFPYTTLVRSRDGNKRSLSAAPLSPFVSSEVETPIELAPPRWASRLRSMRTGWVSCCVYYRPLPERRLVKRAQFPAVKLCAFVSHRPARADAALEVRGDRLQVGRAHGRTPVTNAQL